MSTLPTPFVPSRFTLPPDLYSEIVAALFQPGMRILATETPTNRYGWPVKFRELSKEQIPHRVCIARLAQTCKALNNTIKTKIELCTHKALCFFMLNTIWASQRFARKSYADRAEMHRLWWPERWPYATNAEVARTVPRYTLPNLRVIKLFIVWIHRRRDSLAVQIGIHEHEGPIRVFKITDHDPDEVASDSASDSDSILTASDSEAGTTTLAAINELGTDFVITDQDVLSVLENDESEDDDALIPVTAINAVDDEDVENNLAAAAEADAAAEAEAENEDEADDRNAEEIDLHYSTARPRWSDPDRRTENVTKAELTARVEAWIRLQHEQFFPFLVATQTNDQV